MQPAGAIEQNEELGVERYPLAFLGSGLSLGLIIVKGFVLTALTFGIYYFWAKTERRKFIWQNFEFAGNRFAYTGNANELLIGWLKACLVFFVLGFLLSIIHKVSPLAGGVVYIVGFYVLVPFILFKFVGYLATRTTWSNIRLHVKPNSKKYAQEFWRGLLWTIATFGLYAPIMMHRSHKVLLNSISCGNLQLRYTGSNRSILKLYLRHLPLMILTLGLYYPWFYTRYIKYILNRVWLGNPHPDLGSARGRIQITGTEICALWIISFLATVFTFGIATPWVTTNYISYFAERFYFKGYINFSHVRPINIKSVGAGGDGLADLMDLGL